MVWADLLAVEYLGTPHACKFQAPGNVFVHQAGDIEYLPQDEQGKFDFSYNPPLPPTVEEVDDLRGIHEDF